MIHKREQTDSRWAYLIGVAVALVILISNAWTRHDPQVGPPTKPPVAAKPHAERP
jgi:hypothetical protein